MKTKLIFPVAFLLNIGNAFSQGTFQNLNFEAANVAGYQPSSTVPTALAFPGWEALIVTAPTSGAIYDDVSIGSPAFAIIDDKIGFVPIEGNYTAYLMSAVIVNESYSVTLSQTGTVPTGTESIQLDANQAEGSSFVVTLGGQTINMVALQAFANYTLYAGNVSAWAGQSATLAITELPASSQEFSPSLLQLDNITFSTTSVPEPAPFLLTGLGGTLFALYRRFAPKRK